MTSRLPTNTHPAMASAVALHSKEQLKSFLLSSGRKYIVLNSADLVDALSWPAGVTTFQDIVEAYRQFRAQRVTDDGRLMGDVLEPDEIAEVIEQLQNSQK